jgi:two-component system, NtrC family, response regulator AtoC
MSGHVLVLDDDEAMRELLAETLESEGYRVQCAASVDVALQLVRERNPRVVLFDLTLGAQSGQAFVEAYRALPDAQAALIVLSGAPGLAHVADALQLDGYLTKPFDLDALSLLVRAAFNGDRQA